MNNMVIHNVYTSFIVLSLSCNQLFCEPMDCSPPGSSVHGIFQARILEWVATSFSRGSSWTRDWTHVSCLAGVFFTTEPPVLHLFVVALQLLNCVWLLCDPMDPLVPLGSFVHEISKQKNTGVGCHFLLQGLFLTRALNPHPSLQVDSLLLSYQGAPYVIYS